MIGVFCLRFSSFCCFGFVFTFCISALFSYNSVGSVILVHFISFCLFFCIEVCVVKIYDFCLDRCFIGWVCNHIKTDIRWEMIQSINIWTKCLFWWSCQTDLHFKYLFVNRTPKVPEYWEVLITVTYYLYRDNDQKRFKSTKRVHS